MQATQPLNDLRLHGPGTDTTAKMKLFTFCTVLAAVACTSAAMPIADHAAAPRQTAPFLVQACVIGTSKAQHDLLGVYVRSTPCNSGPAPIVAALYDTNSVYFLGQYKAGCTGNEFAYARI